ncbi:2-hydroxyacid dehydrogenase [Vallitalea longa]|uniref:2-hydroxyacid dehydrogenase n=1 Tax=Vallitalea longa TaxID=2936439 RepID=A0A9W5YFN9_9FIRM|nr:D-2-hydroxyacid dehydrogenase [Vallitalea longa]GKX31059.1 2-hydroxyacid dehydrogenase [Vallitalea longa]
MKIVILDANTLGDDLDLSVYDDFGEVEVYGFTSKEQVVERIKDANVIITNKIVLDESNLKYARNLQLICLTATGTNNVDKNYTNAHGIVVSNVVGYSTESVVQHTFALLFYLYENLSYYDRYVKSGTYVGDSVFSHFENKYNEINGKTWGIIGLGTIGKRVADVASCFGCRMIYYSTSGNNHSTEYEKVNLDTLIRTSDIISIHAPLNENTDDLITYKEFINMKDTAVILNLGRGRIINENHLAKALKEELIAGAGIDVLEHEPINEGNPLLDIQDSGKLFITPHIAWASVEARQRVIIEIKENIASYIKGTPRNVVTK